MMVALEMNSADQPILDYLDFFTGQVPVASIHFLHVMPRIDFFNPDTAERAKEIMGQAKVNNNMLRRMEESIRERLSKHQAVYLNCQLKEGNPLVELLINADDLNADLVVIGQKSGVSQHGILARNLAKRIKTNALIVPDQSRQQLRKMLVPIDFSADSARALQTAVQLNERLTEPARIVALNVYDLPNLGTFQTDRSHEELKAVVEQDRQEAFRSFLRQFVPQQENQIQTQLLERREPGTAAYLYDYARTNDVDFILIGARGHSKVEQLLMGSVTEKLLTINESIPTLVVKAATA